jgi:hypothetical protein
MGEGRKTEYAFFDFFIFLLILITGDVLCIQIVIGVVVVVIVW